MTRFNERALTAFVLTAVVLAGCGDGDGEQVDTRSSQEPAAESADALELPAGLDYILDIASTPDGSALWIFAGGADAQGVPQYHALRSTDGETFDVDVDLGDAQAGGFETALLNDLVVDSTGTAWIGARRALISVTSDGAVTLHQLPQVPTIPAREANLPESARSAQEVQALAIGSDRRLAIGLSNAAALIRFDPTSGSTDQVPLPDGAEAVSIALTADGTAAVAVRQFERGGRNDVVLIDETGHRRAVGLQADFVAADGDEVIAVGATARRVRRDGTASAVAAPRSARLFTAPPAVRAGSILFGTPGTVYETEGGDLTATYVLPSHACDASHTPGGPATTATTESQTCDAAPAEMARTGFGDYVLLSGHQRALVRLA